MREGRTEIAGVVMFERSLGTLKIDAEDEYILAGKVIKLKLKNKHLNYIGVSLHDDNGGRCLARCIMNPPDNMEVDHINHDTLDNRKCNLRICTRSENRRNGRKQCKRTGARFKGVFYHAQGTHNGSRSNGVVKRWRAYTRIMGKRIWLGYYASDTEAAMAYNRFAAKEFKEYACFNRFDSCPALSAIGSSDGQMFLNLA